MMLEYPTTPPGPKSFGGALRQAFGNVKDNVIEFQVDEIHKGVPGWR
jgi:hypothetical protein